MIARTFLRAGLALIVAGVLTACSNLGLNAADDKAARTAYEQIRSGDRAALERWAGPEMKNLDAATWEQIRGLIPQEPPTSVAVTGWKYNVATGSGNTLETVHTYEYSDRTVRAETVLRRAANGTPWTVIGFHVKAEPKAAASSQPAASGQAA